MRGGTELGTDEAAPVTLSIVVPCYNEEEAVGVFHKAVTDVLRQCSAVRSYEIIFVDDGSVDDTLGKIKNLSNTDNHVVYVSFSRNFGKEAALYAGFTKARGEYVALMDVDLQDPPALLVEMITFLVSNKDYDLTGCRRVDRKGENAVTSLFSDMFYKVMASLTDINVVPGARDFHVMRRYVADAVLSLGEANRFSKGIFSWIGFKCKYFEYHNVERVAGQTKWSFWKLLRYSIDGITAFSNKPLVLSSILGVMSIFAAFVMCCVIIFRKVLYGDATSGWPSLVCIIFFIGGLQLFTVGILGTYISKIFTEVKHRPLYITKEENHAPL